VSSEWRYLVQAVDGINPPTLLIPDLALTDVTITDALNGPGELTGNIPVEQLGLRDLAGNLPVLRPWGCAVWAEASGQIKGGGMLVSSRFQGSSWALTCVGFSSYPEGQPYEDSTLFVEADPLDIFRHIWNHVQGKKGADLGMTVANTSSPVRIGHYVEGGDYDQPGSPTFEDGPYRLAWYETEDLGTAIDDLAQSTPFDWRETIGWNADRTTIDHHIDIGYPRLGRRRHDLRFVHGENIRADPSIDLPEDSWASHLLLLGAGEGRDMVRGTASRALDSRVRRATVVSSPDLRRRKLAGKKARRALARINGNPTLDSIEVYDHVNAPLGTWQCGDEIRIQVDDGWAPFDGWFKIVESTIRPDQGDVATLSLERTDQGVLT
jgi:hypothetical protein